VNKAPKLLLALLFCTSALPAIAQGSETAFGSWTGIELRYSISDFTFSLEEELRLKDDLKALDELFTEISAEYEPGKNLEFGTGIRFIRNNDNTGGIQGNENLYRYHIDAVYKASLKKLRLRQRVRYQNKNEIGSNNRYITSVNQHLRYKSAATYKIRNWKADPQFAVELFYQLGKRRPNEFDKIRWTLGTDLSLGNRSELKIDYRYEHELNSSKPTHYHILSVAYAISFKANK
jgi:hypothetical protein